MHTYNLTPYSHKIHVHTQAHTLAACTRIEMSYLEQREACGVEDEGEEGQRDEDQGVGEALDGQHNQHEHLRTHVRYQEGKGRGRVWTECGSV